MIPRVINYCWFGDKPLPPDAKKCIKTWKKNCPGFEIIEWNENNFDVNCHPFVKAAYAAKAWAFVTDYARLKIIYENGGIYLDTDVRVIKNFSSLLNYPAFFGAEQLEYFVATGLGFGAEKGNSMVEALLRSYDDISFDATNLRNISCPRLNTVTFIKYDYKQIDECQNLESAVIFPPRFFDPVAPGSDKNLICKDTYSIHMYNASWTTDKNNWKRKMRKIIGEQNVIKIKRLLCTFNIKKIE